MKCKRCKNYHICSVEGFQEVEIMYVGGTWAEKRGDFMGNGVGSDSRTKSIPLGFGGQRFHSPLNFISEPKATHSSYSSAASSRCKEAHNQFETNAQFHVQHLLRKLGSESCVGQQVILAVSQRISLLSENLLFLDPFDSAFFEMHTSLYILIQLIECLVSDNLISWSKTDGFASELLEEWVTSILHARKGLQLLESRCGLYILYMDRVIGLIAKLVAQITSLHNLNTNILQTLLC
ncbi:unnamed protein product [Lactuca saligna]|uniref:Uncharacterized protein n=1 Tax=Lactuca saligna TaxID=75948 RepID=A0AA35Z488_LACSI|nr:unnamed protein product [Lactuca saligna]